MYHIGIFNSVEQYFLTGEDSSVRIPGNMEPAQVPQMITITFNGAVNSDNLDLYQEIFADRLNPNGCGIKGRGLCGIY